MNSLVIAVLVALTAHRLWRLAALDTVTDGLRLRFAPEGTKRFELVSCPWCLGTWVAATTWALTWWQLPLAAPGLVLGAAASLVGVFGTVDKWHHNRPQ